MKKTAYFPVLALLLAGLAVPPLLAAQDLALDSLEQLAAASKDTTRIDALLKWASRLRRTDLDKSVEVFETAIVEAEKLGDLKRRLRAVNGLGITYGMKEEYALAIRQFQTGLKLHTETGNLTGMADSYNNIGIVHRYTGDYARSLEAYNRALALNDSLNDQSGRGACFHNIGVVYDMMGDEALALDFFKKALELKKAGNDEVDYSLTLHSIALVLEKQGKPAEALPLLFEHLDILKKHGDEVREAGALNTIGKVYLAMNNFEAAESYLSQASGKAVELGLREPLAHVFYNLAKIRLQKNQPQAAVPLLEQQLELAAGLNSFVLQKQGHDLMAEAHAAAGDHRRAFGHLMSANVFRDSLFNEEKNRSLRQWQARLDVFEKDRLLGEQQQQLGWMEERLQAGRKFHLALALALLLALAAAVLFFQKNKLRQQANRELEEKNRRIEAQRAEIAAMNHDLEKRMLRAQMNPHFIFNSLGSIQHFITANDRANALRYLSRFSNLLRQVLEDSVASHVVLEEEIQLLNTYLELEALRFNGEFSYRIHLDPQLDPYNTEIPVLLVQPFLENAILHGLLPKNGERTLDLFFSGENGHTVCRITDNGIGRQAAAALKVRKAGSRPSRGIEVAKKRLQALDKTRPVESLLHINDLYHPDGTPAGTEVIVKIPNN